MTRAAIIGNSRVIKDRRREHRIGMADVTILGSRNMAASLEYIRIRYEPGYMAAFTTSADAGVHGT